MIESFLLGVIATSSIAAGMFFLRFWRETRDYLFLAFAVAFLVEGVNRCLLMLIRQSGDHSSWIYLVRSLAFLIILAGIVSKNRSAKP